MRVVTAEPHFAATMPSTMVAHYNVGDDMGGTESKDTTRDSSRGLDNIESHTDSVGNVRNNDEQSLQRSIAVRDYLIGQGVAASNIDVAGLDPSMPVGDHSTLDGRARNPRVKIVISGGP